MTQSQASTAFRVVAQFIHCRGRDWNSHRCRVVSNGMESGGGPVSAVAVAVVSTGTVAVVVVPTETWPWYGPVKQRLWPLSLQRYW